MNDNIRIENNGTFITKVFYKGKELRCRDVSFSEDVETMTGIFEAHYLKTDENGEIVTENRKPIILTIKAILKDGRWQEISGD